MNKKESFQILWRKFDPISVLGEDSECPDDEYDAYANESYDLLKRGASLKELEEYITHICHEHIGICTPEFHIQKFSKQLFDLYNDAC